ncbi:hypothetical protein [Halomarina litorea]|uniref:hypothetical protein n=1 Tax=Halomarina litorea TaxID=2961595 RepID=UPI0020C4D499|nr:hypothetical protein [Halomarina sp. BCD28]
MSDDNPFADLDKSVAGEESAPRASEGDGEDATEEPDAPDPQSTPAFEAGNHLNHSVYVRDETWQAFEDTYDIDLVPTLRRAGVDGLSKREFHDAALRLAREEPERVAELLLEERGLDPDDYISE